MYFCWILAFLINLNVCFGKGLKVYYNVSDEDYDLMPPLFHLENFDICMDHQPSTLYCFATFQLSPLNPQWPSKIWNIITEVISAPRTYRHDKIRHGLCIPKTCPEIPAKYYKTKNGTDQLWRALSECYSAKYSQLELSCEVIKLHCQDQNPQFEVDNVDLLFAFVLSVLLLLVLIGTVYEISSKSTTNETDKNHHTYTYHEILKKFSLVSNWEKLLKINTSEDAVPLYPLQGVRVYNTLFVIFSHTIMVLMGVPVYNERFVEDTTLKTESMFASNGSLICQTFFFISAFHLSSSFYTIYSNKKVKISDLVHAFVYRFFRLVPMLLLAVGFSATWFRHFGNGPFWEHIGGTEFKNCRKNWWVTLFFLNNVYRANEMCLQQTWYLSADTQLFIVGLIVMYIIMNNRQHAKLLFALFTVVPLLISVAHNYYLDVDIVFRSYSETAYTFYLQYEQWTSVFGLPHFAIPTYVHGLTCGFYYHTLKQQKRLLIKNRVIQLIHLIFVWVVPITTVLIAIQFYKEGYEHNRLLAAVYQGLNRYIFCFFLGTFLLAAVSGENGPMERVCRWPPVLILIKLQYSVFLIHVWPIKLIYGSMRTLTFIDNFKIFVESIEFTAVGIVFGTIVYLFFEMPLCSMQKIIMNIDKNREEATKEKSQ